MRIKGLVDEDFVNYKKASMFISIGDCDWKCCKDGNFDISICQNSALTRIAEIELNDKFIYDRYITNPITKAVVIGGLEPMTRFNELYDLIKLFRNNNCNDEFVIYTGYNADEIQDEINKLCELNNIIIKFGRFKLNDTERFDEVLGVTLASSNQYAKKIS